MGFCPVGRFDIPERFDAWEERGMQRWISRDGTAEGGKRHIRPKTEEDAKGLSAGGVQNGNMLYDHDEARESG